MTRSDSLSLLGLESYSDPASSVSDVPMWSWNDNLAMWKTDRHLSNKVTSFEAAQHYFWQYTLPISTPWSG